MSAVEFGDGARVRVVVESASGDAEIDAGAAPVGGDYTVFCFAEGEEGDDPNGRDYYLLDSEGSYGGGFWAYPEHLALVMSASGMAARQVPTEEAIRRGVSSALLGMSDPIEASETDHRTPGEVYVTGTTSEGLWVSFRVRIDEIVEVDQ